MATLVGPPRVGHGQTKAPEQEADGTMLVGAVRRPVVPTRRATATEAKGVLHPARPERPDLAGARFRPVAFGVPVRPDTETAIAVPTETVTVEAPVPGPFEPAVPEPPVEGIQVGLEAPNALRAVTPWPPR